MVKISICLSGHCRNYKTVYPNLKEQLIDKYDCDIFISTFDEGEKINSEIIELYNPTAIKFNKNDDEYNLKIEDHSNNLNQVNILTADVQNKNQNNDVSYKNSKFFSKIHDCEIIKQKITSRALSQFYGIYDVSMLCFNYVNDNNITYDYIIRLRLDAYLNGTFLNIHLENNEVVVGNIDENYNVSVADHFFIAKPETYFKISSLYLHLNTIIDYVNNNNYFIPICGYQETILFLMIMINNINIKCSWPNNYLFYKL
jgi:hypothetical protein